MKKNLLLFILINVLTFCAYSQENKPHLKIGGGITLGDWASTSDGWEEDWGAGVSIRALIYSDKSRFSISPSYIYFPVSKFNYTDNYSSNPTTIKVDPVMHYINVEGRFSFVKSPKVESYLLLGPSFFIYNEDISVTNESIGNIQWEGDNVFKTGAVAGLGLNLYLSKSFCIYTDASYSYIPDDWDQLLITAGVLFRVF